MHFPRLDFSARRHLLSPPGSALLLLGILLAVSAADAALDAVAQRRSAQETLERLTTRVASLRGFKTPQARAAMKDVARESVLNDSEARHIVDAQDVIRALSTPWNEWFDSLEQAQDDAVALLTITPERAAGRLALSGEARDYEALTAYLARLDDSRSLMNAQLLAHEIKGSERSVFFLATASFRR